MACTTLSGSIGFEPGSDTTLNWRCVLSVSWGFSSTSSRVPSGCVAITLPGIEYAWRVTEALLATLRNEVEASGAKFVLVTVASPDQYDDGAWAWSKRAAGKLSTDTFDRNHPEERFAAITQRHGFRWIPLLPGFREERKHRELNFGYGHWNEAGNQLAATIVLKQLNALGLTD